MLWAFSGLGWKDNPLSDAIASEALRRIRAYEEQDLSGMAWSMDVLERWSSLAAILPATIERFEVLGTEAPAISWVELCSAASAFGTAIEGNEKLQANLCRSVIDPALELLHRLVS